MKNLSNHFNYNLDKSTQIRRKWKIRSLPLHPNAHNYNNISIPEFEPMPKQSIIYTSIYFVNLLAVIKTSFPLVVFLCNPCLISTTTKLTIRILSEDLWVISVCKCIIYEVF